MRFSIFANRLAVVILLSLSLVAGGQSVPELKLTNSGKTLSFQLDSFEREEVWMLEYSLDGKEWSDLIYLEGGSGLPGFGVSIGRNALPGDAGGTVFFRAARLAADHESYREFLAAQARWREAGISSYTYLVRSGRGQVSYEARYTVLNGEVATMETVSIYPPFFTAPDDLTMDDWFETVSSAIEQNAVIVDVDWNAEAGYPERGFIDLEEFLADEEQSWRILEFAPIESP